MLITARRLSFPCLVAVLLAVRLVSAADFASECLVLYGMISNSDDRGSRNDELNAIFWKLYKNDPAFAPWLKKQPQPRKEPTERSHSLIDDGDIQRLVARYRAEGPAADSASARTIDLQAASKIDPASLGDYERLGPGSGWLNQPVTIYEGEVLHLKKGDTVIFGARSFRLASFVGAGNTTHIWEIEGRPNVLLRIPLLTRRNRTDFSTGATIAERIEFWGKRYAETSKPNLPPGIRSVKVLETGEKGAYSLVERIGEGENGNRYLESIRGNTEAEKTKKYKRLWEIITAVKDKGCPECDRPDQYVWDTVGQDWVLADW